jgi:hypothetical protein
VRFGVILGAKLDQIRWHIASPTPNAFDVVREAVCSSAALFAPGFTTGFYCLWIDDALDLRDQLPSAHFAIRVYREKEVFSHASLCNSRNVFVAFVLLRWLFWHRHQPQPLQFGKIELTAMARKYPPNATSH